MADSKPAETNPWYVLSTLHGPQTGKKIDRELGAKNVALWNVWSCQNLTEEERAKLRDAGADVPDAGAWEGKKEEIEKLYKKRFSEMEFGKQELPELPDAKIAIDMSKIAFSHRVVWEKAIFGQAADFSGAKFKKEFHFVNSRFVVIANFDSTTFLGSAKFKFSAFLGRAEFYNVKFFEYVDFTDSKFHDYTDFAYLHFLESVSFRSSKFLDVASFESSSFRGDTSFHYAEFSKLADFTGANFFGSAIFKFVKFSGFTQFQRAIFGRNDLLQISSKISFSDTIFERPTSFRHAEFKQHYPELDGAVFHDKTQFTAEHGFWPTCRQPDPKQAKESCAALRHVVAKQSLPEDEYFFFRKEMEFASEIGGFWKRLPVKTYGVLSDYGASIAKPIVGLGSLWLFCALVYMLAFNWPGVVEPKHVPAGKGFGLSAANMVKFLGFQRTYYADVIQNVPNWMQFMVAVQTTFAYVLVFFLGLGLRSRFRLR